jgi:hypothetical protein
MTVPGLDLSVSADLLPATPRAPRAAAIAAAAVAVKHDTPHLAFPFRYENGAFVEVDQDSIEHMRDRIHVLVRTRLGSRLDDPSFGIPDDLERAGGVNIDALAAAIGSSEPDIPVLITVPGDEGHDDPGHVVLPSSTAAIHLRVGAG